MSYASISPSRKFWRWVGALPCLWVWADCPQPWGWMTSGEFARLRPFMENGKFNRRSGRARRVAAFPGWLAIGSVSASRRQQRCNRRGGQLASPEPTISGKQRLGRIPSVTRHAAAFAVEQRPSTLGAVLDRAWRCPRSRPGRPP
jgi:hypothetical protein